MIDAAHETQADEVKKEVDFFEEHEKLQLSDDNSLVCLYLFELFWLMTLNMNINCNLYSSCSYQVLPVL